MKPATSVPEGYLADNRGRLVPAAMVKPEHLEMDAVVRRVFAKATEISEALRAFREDSFAEIDALLDLLDEKYKAPIGGERGNVTLRTFDGLMEIQVAIGDKLTFGPELESAKKLVDSCILRWSKDAGPELKAMVMQAFDVDQKGKLKVDRILGLKKLNIADPEWSRAMEAISAAVDVHSSKRYMRAYSRASADDKPKLVPLTLASA